MNIASELGRLQQSKADLETAIEAKGVTVPAEALLDDYPALVDDIVQLDTSDATATEYDIVAGKTAYVADGTKKTGVQSARWKKPDAWPNIHQIIEADTEAGYTYKYIYLMADDAVSSTFTVTAANVAFKLSDGPTLITSTTTHTWNAANDIAGTRWVIVYTAAEAATVVLPFEVLWLDGWNTLMGPSGYRDKSRLRCIDGVFNTNFSGTQCAEMFSWCASLVSIPEVLNLTSCTSAYRIFYVCGALTAVPDVLDISSCNTAAGLFSSCNSLLAVPSILDFTACTTVTMAFYSCAALTSLPSVLNLAACTTTLNTFNTCLSLLNAPTDITVALASDALVTLNFAQSTHLRKASVCTFDGGGAVNGGLVFSLDTVTTARALTLNATVKALFSGTEQTAVANYVTSKNWTLTW